MFARLFGGGKSVAAVEDAVWLDRTARDAGWLPRTAAGPQLVVLHSAVDLDAALAALAPLAPERIADGYEAMGLAKALKRPDAVVVALADRLRTRAAAGGVEPVAFDARVRGRATLKRDDATLVDALARLGARRIVFHSALDEAPLAEHARAIAPLLQRLGLAAGESITSPVLTRSIERLQR